MSLLFHKTIEVQEIQNVDIVLFARCFYSSACLYREHTIIQIQPQEG